MFLKSKVGEEISVSLKIQFTDEQKKDICKKYLVDKKTLKQIALVYNISDMPIKRLFKELNIKTRPPEETSRRFFYNENYFENVDSYDKAYFLGLLMADGYNDEKHGAVSLSLGKRDKYVLERFRVCLSSTKPLHYFKTTEGADRCGINLYGRKFSQDLAHLGCMQAKSFKIKFPDYLSDDLKRHFIRGYFDGDGCLSYTFAKRNNYFGNSFLSSAGFCSTEDICLYLQKYFKDKLNLSSGLSCRHPENNNNNRGVAVRGNQQVIKLMDWLYADTDLYLKRKHDKLVKIKEILKERAPIVSKMRSDNGVKVMLVVNEQIRNHKLILPR